jgi:hypothetical protein
MYFWFIEVIRENHEEITLGGGEDALLPHSAHFLDRTGMIQIVERS